MVGTDELGKARIEPAGTFPVCHMGTWKIIYTVGRFGLDDGGSILIAQRDMTDAWPLQSEDPGGAGYVSASTTGNARLLLAYDAWRWIRPWRGALSVSVRDGSLGPGESISVILGDRSGGSPGWMLQTFPETRHEFRILVDPFGTRAFRPLKIHPHIRIIPGRANALEAILSSAVVPGEEVPVRIRAMDRWGNPVEGLSGVFTIEDNEGIVNLTRSLHLDQGVGDVGRVRLEREGVHRFSLSSGSLAGSSNPVLVSTGARPIFWADLHGQTEDTIGTGTVEEYFGFARDRALIDVVSWQGNDFQVTDATWGRVCEETKRFHEPGTFVTFLGYEWSGLTPAGGDHNILYLEDDQPVRRSTRWQAGVSSQDKDYYPISRLWKELEGKGEVMAIAHVGGRHSNLDLWDPAICRLVEVHSCHGTFEWLAEEALSRGFIVGFVGGSDDHSGRPGLSPPLRRGGVRGSVRLDLHGGLTGIYADALTREGVWEALRSRHCYATTGKRIILDVRMESSMMGDVVEAESPFELLVNVAGTAPLLDVEVRRDANVIYRYPATTDADEAWVRIDWSGLRVKGRNKRAEWHAKIVVSGGRIEEFRRFGFEKEGDSIEASSVNELKVTSATTGDTVGVLLRIVGKRPRVRFESPFIQREVDVAELGDDPVEFDAGGFNLKLRFGLSQRLDSQTTSFEFSDPEPPGDAHAYWVKILQVDGHMAWSSPIYLRP